MDGDPGHHPTVGRSAWDALGDGTALRYEGAELWWVELALAAPVGTAVGTHRSRPLVLVRLRCRTASGDPVDGWGECAALADPTFDHEDVADAWATLEERLLPALASRASATGGTLPPVGGVVALADTAPGRPLAYAALEMAVGDAHLRSAGRSFASLLGVAGSRVRPGAVVGTAGSTRELVDRVAERAAEGYVRVKVKIEPRTGLGTVSALAGWAARTDGPVPGLQVDANGAYGSDDLADLVALDRFGLLCIEQPFARDDLDAHRRLAARIRTPVCLDESLDGPARVVEAVTTGACSVVCVKPSRLGGIGAALDVVGWCVARRVPWWIGGMFESGYGRGVTTALAALPGPSLPGDLAPASTYLTADLVAPVLPTVLSGPPCREVAVPDAPGMGPAPEASALAAHGRRRSEVPGPG